MKFLLPLMVAIFVLEYSLGLLESGRKHWYIWLADYFRCHRADCLFVGSSMTSAAINVNDFADELFKRSGRRVLAVNMGEGYTTIPEYYFGLRKVLEANPQALKNITVFIEAPSGMPKFTTWHDDWMNSHSPRLLSLYLKPADVFHYVTSTNVPLTEKIVMPLSRFSLLVTFAPVIQETIFDQIEAAIDSIFPHRPEIQPQVELSNAGGIRSDLATVTWLRKSIRDEAERDMLSQKPIDWDKTAAKDLVQLIEDHGGKVYFYRMPISSVMERPLQTPIRLADKKRFAEVAQSWHCQLLNPKFVSASDDDFPDLLHIRSGRAKEMSRALADAYAQSLVDKVK